MSWIIGIGTWLLDKAFSFIGLKEQRRIRKEDIDRANKKDALIKIENWAKAGHECFYGFTPDRSGAPDFEKRLATIYAEKDGIVILAREFSSGFPEVVKRVGDELQSYWYHPNEPWIEPEERVKRANHLEDAFFALMNIVATLRAELKL